MLVSKYSITSTNSPCTYNSIYYICFSTAASLIFIFKHNLYNKSFNFLHFSTGY